MDFLPPTLLQVIGPGMWAPEVPGKFLPGIGHIAVARWRYRGDPPKQRRSR